MNRSRKVLLFLAALSAWLTLVLVAPGRARAQESSRTYKWVVLYDNDNFDPPANHRVSRTRYDTREGGRGGGRGASRAPQYHECSHRATGRPKSEGSRCVED
jgi:hypothetical protein